MASLVDVTHAIASPYARNAIRTGLYMVNSTYNAKRCHGRDQYNSGSPSDSRVLTISSDLPTVLQVLNEVVPNLEEVSAQISSMPA